MILLNDFYSIVHQVPATGSVQAKIAINKNHKILEGHFPGQPIVPGVCMMQIILEMMELNTRKHLDLIAADTIKFLSVIDPQHNPEIDVAITYTEEAGQFMIIASLFADTVTFFKLRATLKIV
jgi:3-hydroxyacyl-[acyl-carrier-protein] dehydratase